ncbi:DNA mismatch repair endonuclease MutL [Alishewanella tabrizica]|uniref:DNA mismatch repair protein MutL n=1 Tax=Alishewanella tabrizica TaxID=671278 RepID=A0ABQ2WMS7_9ALTE|nr:DNA mismatch repair endonuclease MutL [Alishewanella tabrizica]GGW64599.1 DNA mismatch repair protein MutL [Alishewanella tabrizica]
MPIQLLPPQLANQIAAGEVVERPASVVKELVENSLDAGATQIEIDIEKGGSKLIRVRDNGAGIAQQELMLALSRHATSKIATLADLEQIVSLGFRGEALASISSVSRLTLTSKPETQSAAWQANAEGRDMAVQVKPAAHPTGTSIDVVDLFFNTPARRRFLRSDKTEFSHIDELIKRLALSRFDVAWTLTHNGQPVRRLPIADSPAAKQKRLAALCGRSFAEQALWIENHYGQLQLSGWLLAPAACQATAACQYSYVNGRMMRDKLLNHAIRQAYGERLPAELQPAFVLYLELDPADLDVNVHPAKHEVRFHQARLVHDFVVSALSDALAQLSTDLLPSTVAEPERYQTVSDSARFIAESVTPSGTDGFVTQRVEHHDIQHVANHVSAQSPRSSSVYVNKGFNKEKEVLSQSSASPQHAIAYLAASQVAVEQERAQPSKPYLIVDNRYVLYQEDTQLRLNDLVVSVARYWPLRLDTAPLLLPLRINLTAEELAAMLSCADSLESLGFDLLIKDNTAIIRRVPIWLRHTAISQWFSAFVAQLAVPGAIEPARLLLQLVLSTPYLQAELLLHYFPEAVFADQHDAKVVVLDVSDATLQVVKHEC